VTFAPVVIDPSGWLAGLGVGLFLLVAVSVAAGGLIIFRRMTGL
jgi:hypothetical protein